VRADREVRPNLDAWSNRIETRGTFEVIDSHDLLTGIFDGEQNRQRAAAPVHRDVGQEPVLDLVPLRSARRRQVTDRVGTMPRPPQSSGSMRG
jgi:hypothetical protein